MNRLLDFFGDMFGRFKEFQARFPGVTPESLAKGWIPVPQTILEQQLRQQTGGLAWLKAISLKCVPGSFHIRADTDRYLLEHRTHLAMQCEQFAVNTNSQSAVFSCNEPIAIEGRNLLGAISVWLARGIVVSAVKGGIMGKQLGAVSKGALELEWPRITVYLDKIDRVQSILTQDIFGRTILDFLSLGPLRIEDEHVQLKISKKK